MPIAYKGAMIFIAGCFYVGTIPRDAMDVYIAINYYSRNEGSRPQLKNTLMTFIIYCVVSIKEILIKKLKKYPNYFAITY